MVIPIEVFNLIDEFLNYSKSSIKTGEEKLNAIVESCKRHRMSNPKIRMIINKLWSELRYSESYKRRLLSDRYPQLVNSKFVNNKKKATKIIASPPQEQERTGDQGYITQRNDKSISWS